MYTAEIDYDILDRLHVDTKNLAWSRPVEEFGAPEEFTDPLWKVKGQRVPDFTY